MGSTRSCASTRMKSTGISPNCRRIGEYFSSHSTPGCSRVSSPFSRIIYEPFVELRSRTSAEPSSCTVNKAWRLDMERSLSGTSSLRLPSSASGRNGLRPISMLSPGFTSICSAPLTLMIHCCPDRCSVTLRPSFRLVHAIAHYLPLCHVLPIIAHSLGRY